VAFQFESNISENLGQNHAVALRPQYNGKDIKNKKSRTFCYTSWKFGL